MGSFADFRGDTKDAGRALAAISAGADGEAGRVVLPIVREIAKRASRNQKSAPGTWPKSPDFVTLIPNTEGGSVRVDAKRAPWARGAEYGAAGWHVPRGNVPGRRARGYLQSAMKRQTFGRWVGRDPFGGYIVGKAWRSVAREAPNVAADGMQESMGESFDRHGVKKRGL